jgi:hypothetical protein
VLTDVRDDDDNNNNNNNKEMSVKQCFFFFCKCDNRCHCFAVRWRNLNLSRREYRKIDF